MRKSRSYEGTGISSPLQGYIYLVLTMDGFFIVLCFTVNYVISKYKPSVVPPEITYECPCILSEL
jgi:hypothetical protein